MSTAREILALADKVEALLISGKSDWAVKRELGLHRHKASRMVRMVRQRWVNEADKVDRSQKRAQLREMILEHYRQCMEAQEPVAVWESRDSQVVEMKPKPDLKAAGRALELLCRFDGLLEQPGGGANDLQMPLATQMAALLGINVTVEVNDRRDERALASGQMVDMPQGEGER